MNQSNKISQFSQLPIKQQQRIKSDLFCTIANTVFILIMFILALVLFDQKNLQKMTYPTDSQGSTCGDSLPLYPYIYFPSPINNPNKRLCVSKCPKQSQNKLACYPTPTMGCARNNQPEYQILIYDTSLINSRIGLFCLPSHQKTKQNLIKIAGIDHKLKFIAAYDMITTSLWISLITGILYFSLIHFCARLIPKFFIIFGGSFFIVISILIWMSNSSQQQNQIISDLSKIIFGIFIFFIGVLLVYSFFKYRSDIQLCGLFLFHANKFIRNQNNWRYVFIIPIFMLLTFVLTVIIVFQILAGWSASQLIFYKNQVYYTPKNSDFGVFFIVISFIQFIWGLSFLKQACNFIISGKAVEYYFTKDIGNGNSQVIPGKQINSIKNLFKYHWGSVVGGSFLLAFFWLLDLIFDTFSPQQEQQQKKQPSKKQKGCYKSCCSFLCIKYLKSFFELIRSESMAYINLTGLPYCDASIYCQYLNYTTDFFDNNQSINRMHRMGTHCTLISIIISISGFTSQQGFFKMSLFAYIFAIVMSYFIITFFITMHTDAAEGILITYLAQIKVESNEINNVKRNGKNINLNVCKTDLQKDIKTILEKQR